MALQWWEESMGRERVRESSNESELSENEVPWRSYLIIAVGGEPIDQIWQR
jgi:hypothetical protein